MIHPHNNDTSNRWSHDEFKVQLNVLGQAQPMGYCDGSDEDEQVLRSQAEDEGVEDLRIDKKRLKLGREVWTIGQPPSEEDEG